VLLEIEDDGRGFDPSAVTSTIGLTSMQARVRLLGGDFEILSKDEQGGRPGDLRRTSAVRPNARSCA
jgi:signal transduction histidine kinase